MDRLGCRSWDGSRAPGRCRCSTAGRLRSATAVMPVMQQNVEIPEVLPFHPIIQVALDEAAARSGKASIDLIPGSLLRDGAFALDCKRLN